MKKIILTKGLPASGKTTWAKQMLKDNPGQYKRINKDDLRAMLDDGKWSKGNEKFILETRDHLIAEALKKGKHVIVDDTNLHSKHKNHIWRIASENDAIVEVKDFTDVPLDMCIFRDQKRENPVGEKVIRDMYEQFLKSETEKYVPDTSLQPAYIFDIDGTLAKMCDRGPYDWDKVGTDHLNENVAQVLQELKEAGSEILVFTGRDGVCEKETIQWLTDNEVWYTEFRIRPEGNIEKDSVIKRRFFDELSTKYCIKGVFDDRNQVVDMWRDLGLQCYQVNYGDF